MKVKVYWLKEADHRRIGIMPRPRGGDWLEDEILSLREDDVQIIISLLEEEEIEELNLREEKSYCEANSIRYLSLSIPDRGTPQSGDALMNFVCHLAEEFQNGKSIVIHCRQGIGRSSIIAAATLIIDGLSAEEALKLIERKRGCSIPDTEEQSNWVKGIERKLRDSKEAA